MNFEEIILHHPLKILQVYRHIYIYGKENKKTDERSIANTWHSIPSSYSYFLKGGLYIAEDSLITDNIKNSFAILIVDDNTPSASLNVNESVNILNLTHPKKWGFFEISLKEKLELHLKYDHFEVGEPARDDFKLCELNLNQPVEIQINGKLDFSLSSRRARSYKEQFYIFEYLGEVNNVKLVKKTSTPIIKKVPGKRKIINLLKPLW